MLRIGHGMGMPEAEFDRGGLRQLSDGKTADGQTEYGGEDGTGKAKCFMSSPLYALKC